MRNSFWLRWKAEVFHHLQQRNRWCQRQPNLEVGDIVLIKDENSPPSQWPLARVIKVHPGPDHLVRVATLKTAVSEFQRPVAKLVRLPVDHAAVLRLQEAKKEDKPPQIAT